MSTSSVSNTSYNRPQTPATLKLKKTNVQDEINQLKKDNFKKAGQLLDIQIETAEIELELKKINLQVEQSKINYS